jgi:formate-dependent phosphoribosylglycinamide formyltransferase (GAR transformylase)
VDGEGFGDTMRTINLGVTNVLNVLFILSLLKQVVRELAPIATAYAEGQVKKAAYMTEKKIVEEVITTGQTITQMALKQIDKIGQKLVKHGIHETEHYDVHRKFGRAMRPVVWQGPY